MKLPSNLSGLEIVKILTKYYGWIINRREGSHITLKKEGERELITIPYHDELNRGTLLAILRKAKIDKDDFLKRL